MLPQIFIPLKRYLQFAFLRAMLFFALFLGLNLFTLAMAMLMLLEWHWSPCLIIELCLAPWLLIILVLAVLTIFSWKRFQRSKATLLGFNQGKLLSRLFYWGLRYFLFRKL